MGRLVRVLRMRMWLRRRIDSSILRSMSVLCVLYSVPASPSTLMYYIMPCFALGLGVWLLFEFHLPGIYQSVRAGMPCTINSFEQVAIVCNIYLLQDCVSPSQNTLVT